MTKSFFVTGTDTSVGKTLVSTGLLFKARRQGLSTGAIKPVAAGCFNTAEGLRNEDALALMAQTSVQFSYRQINPIALQPAIAPHIAAAESGCDLTVSVLASHCRQVLRQGCNFTLVEGAGGWQVPLNGRETLADLAVYLKLPVILVVGLRLGCINHALLTAQAVYHSGLPLAAWVACQLDSDMSAVKENVATLNQRLKAPCLGYIPFLQKPDANSASEYLELETLLI